MAGTEYDSEDLILDPDHDDTNEPSQEDIRDYARRIGIDPDKEQELLWLAKEGLLATLPKEWRACFKKKKGLLFYINLVTGEKTRDDPCDQIYRDKVVQERKRLVRPGVVGSRSRPGVPKLHYVEMHVQSRQSGDGQTIATSTFSGGTLDGTSHFQPQPELEIPNRSSPSAITKPEDRNPSSRNPQLSSADGPTDQVRNTKSFGNVTACAHLKSDTNLVQGDEDNNESCKALTESADKSTHVSILMESLTTEDHRITWRRGEMLGKGACSKVWKGLTNTGELIAVKQVELTDYDEEYFDEQWRDVIKEVRILKTLSHDNVVRFLGASLEGKHVCIFMEFAPGGSIQNLLTTFGPFEETVLAKYTKQIIDGVYYIHSKGVIHRDIKGQNIVVTNEGIIKLVDFGCAKRHTLTVSTMRSIKPSAFKTVVGTPHWMAPEVITGSGHGRKSDIWSIGCTIFEMATGQPPWHSLEPIAALFAIGSGKEIPQLPESRTEHFRDFAKSCMTRDPNARPSAKDLLTHPFIAEIPEVTLRSRRANQDERRESFA